MLTKQVGIRQSVPASRHKAECVRKQASGRVCQKAGIRQSLSASRHKARMRSCISTQRPAGMLTKQSVRSSSKAAVNFKKQ